MTQHTALTPAPTFSRLHCHGSRREGQACGRFLGYVPLAVRFARIELRAPEQPDGRTWARCQDCKAWNVYEVSE